MNTTTVYERANDAEPLKVLYVASECMPFIKTGGLADVAGTLPNALSKLGVDARVILPMYRDIPEHWKSQMKNLLYFHVNLGWRRQYCGIFYIKRNNVTYYFIDNEFYFARDSVYGSGQEEGERFSFFCRAALESMMHIGFSPDLIHCNDWQTGMVPALLKTQYSDSMFYRGVKTLFTVHNLRYQGIFQWSLVADLLGVSENYFTPDMLEYYGCVSFMKGGLVFSDHISTVSPTYAKEIQTPYYGERLDGMIRARSAQLSGILNGIDPLEYNPEDDIWLHHHFSADDLEGKAICKADLQKELGLEIRPDVPIVAMVTRLVDQKGLDLVECVLDDIMKNDIQFVVLGKGEEHYQELLSWASWRYQGRLATRIEINNPLSHRIYSASDMILIPSQFEPCGLTQMLAMRYGCLPIVRETGGLKDSVIPYNQYTNEGNGFSFANYNAHEMLFTLQRAINVYQDKEAWGALVKRAMAADFSWDVSAEHYLGLYDYIVGQRYYPERMTNAQSVIEEMQSIADESSIIPDDNDAFFDAISGVQAAPEPVISDYAELKRSFADSMEKGTGQDKEDLAASETPKKPDKKKSKAPKAEGAKTARPAASKKPAKKASSEKDTKTKNSEVSRAKAATEDLPKTVEKAAAKPRASRKKSADSKN